MNNKIKDHIIIPAWNFTREDFDIKKFYFLPGLLSIIFLTALLVYQSIYTYVEVFWKKEEALVIILKFFHSDYVFEVILTALIFIIIYFLATPIFEWGLIKYIASKDNGAPIEKSEAFWLGLYKFFPLFEYNNMFSEFKFISILNAYLFTIRFVWVEYIKYLSYIFLIIFLLSITINTLFSYSKYIIVLDNKKVFESIWISSKIAILNLKQTIKLYFLMFILNIRVIINFIIFLSFPILLVLAIGLITSKIVLSIAITLLSIVFIILIFILWYLTSVLDIFRTSLWYYAYKEWKQKLEHIKESD